MLVQNQRIKSSIAEKQKKVKLKNILFFWGFQILVQTDIENPKIKKLNFWFTLIGPMLPMKIADNRHGILAFT